MNIIQREIQINIDTKTPYQAYTRNDQNISKSSLKIKLRYQNSFVYIKGAQSHEPSRLGD